MKKHWFILQFFLLPFFCFAQPMSGTYIVGGPQGDFATPSLAVQQLQQRGMNGPVTLKIYAGTYWEQIFINNIPGSSTQNKLTLESFSGQNNDVVITFNLQDYQNAFLIHLGDIQHVEIKNLSFLSDGLYSTCIKATHGYHDVLKVHNCVFRSVNCPPYYQSNSNLLLLQNLDSVIITQSTFIGCAAITAPSRSFTNISDNIFYQNKFYIVYSAGPTTSIFSNNIVYSDHIGYSVFKSMTPFSNSSFLAENNIIILKGGFQAVFVTNYLSTVFRNNIIIADSSIGIISWYDLSLYHNTILVKQQPVNYIEKITEMKNNILIANDGPLFQANLSISTVNSNYNIYYSPSNYPFCIFSDTTISSIPDFATWQNMGMDTHTKWGIPLFSKPYDLHLHPGDTLARGAGIPIASVTYDIDGDLRDPLHPDIGADEVVIRPVLDEYYNACIGSPFTLDAGAGFSTYQWSTGATTQTVTLQPSSGTAAYTCTVTFGTLSGQKTTEVRWVDCTGIVKRDRTGMIIQTFPNPATRSITLQASEGNDLPEGTLQIYNLQGIKHIEIPLPQKLQKIEADISTLPAGLFIGRIIGRNGESGVFRFVKSQKVM